MTKYRWHNPDAAVHKSKLQGLFGPVYNELVRYMESLVKEGLIADSGERRWSERTGRYEIVWLYTELGEQLWGNSPSTLKPRRLNYQSTFV
jgi:hypothetical protein